ncbi:STAS domain-containing protein [Deltaproteobacteria bacterium TL4]
MKISIQHETEICIVYASGNMTNEAIVHFEKTLKPLFSQLAFEKDPPLPVLINLANIEYIDSAGIAALVGVHLNCRHWLLELGFCTVSSVVLKSLQRTKLDQMLDIYPNETEGRFALIERQRLSKRCAYEAEVILQSEAQTYKLRSFNLSEGGIGLYSNTEISTNSGTYHVLLLEAQIESDVNIHRCRALEKGYEVVTTFKDPDDALKQKINNLLRQLPSA